LRAGSLRVICVPAGVEFCAFIDFLSVPLDCGAAPRGGQVAVACSGVSMSRKPRACCASAGFTLIEVLIASALLVAMAIGVAQLLGLGVAAGRAARFHTSTAILAAGKLEQLRSLHWSFEPGAGGSILPRSDVSANLSVDPPIDGGPGLAPSPPGTLSANVPPYVDYLDAQGRWVGNGASLPPEAVFIRRWATVPLPQDPSRTLILSVLVTTVRQELSRGGPWTARSGDETLLVVLNTRKGT
jgi:prepilin-type N-terminal cleavage/methylation domain-containing protein